MSSVNGLISNLVRFARLGSTKSFCERPLEFFWLHVAGGTLVVRLTRLSKILIPYGDLERTRKLAIALSLSQVEAAIEIFPSKSHA